MAVSAGICGSWQAAAITRRPGSVAKSSASNVRLQQNASVPMQQRGLCVADKSRMHSKSSTLMSGGFLGLAESLRLRSCGTTRSTCGAPAVSAAGLPGDEKSLLVTGHNDRQGHQGKAGGAAAAAASAAASVSTATPFINDFAEAASASVSTAVPPFINNIAVAVAAVASRLSPPAITKIEIDDLKLIRKVRWLAFYAATMVIAACCYSVMLITHPLVIAFDKQRKIAHHVGIYVWSTLSLNLVHRTEIEGLENLPPADEGAVVFVANHQSFLDMYPLYRVGRPFKYLSKSDNFKVPFIGWMLKLNDYIPLERSTPMSQVLCLKKCRKLVKEGTSVVIFPEGTRAKDGALAEFKKGAFWVAAKEGVSVVPITLIGTGNLIPRVMTKSLESMLRSGTIKMVVHPPIRSKNANELREQSRKVIAETLVKYGLPVHETASVRV